MKEMWDNRYGSHETVYGFEPNGFFRTCIDKLSPGTLLLPAEGEGRNALYAAKKGWQVHAVDYSQVGQQKALARAQSEKVTINYELGDLNNWDTDKTFDCIALIYTHFPSELRKRLFKSLGSKLNPGGTIIMECFHKDQLNYSSGGPKNEDWLYSAELLRKDFEGFQFEQLDELVQPVNESNFHQGEAAIVRMIAKK